MRAIWLRDAAVCGLVMAILLLAIAVFQLIHTVNSLQHTVDCSSINFPVAKGLIAVSHRDGEGLERATKSLETRTKALEKRDC